MMGLSPVHTSNFLWQFLVAVLSEANVFARVDGQQIFAETLLV